MKDTHYRRKVMVGEHADDLRSRLYPKSAELEVMIEALQIRPAPVHLFIERDPTEAPQKLANQFTGFPARRLRQKYPYLRSRLPSRWRSCYSVGWLGSVSAATVRRSSERQQSS